MLACIRYGHYRVLDREAAHHSGECEQIVLPKRQLRKPKECRERETKLKATIEEEDGRYKECLK